MKNNTQLLHQPGLSDLLISIKKKRHGGGPENITAPMIRRVLKEHPNLTLVDIQDEVTCRDHGTVKRNVKEMHKHRIIYISGWVYTEFGKKNMWRPQYSVQGTAIHEKDKLKPPCPTATERKAMYRARQVKVERQRPPQSVAQRLATEHNWDLRILKGIKGNFEHLFMKYQPLVPFIDIRGMQHLFEIFENIIKRRFANKLTEERIRQDGKKS